MSPSWLRRPGCQYHVTMCGIVGIYNLPALVGRFPQALESISHRGPDAHGTYDATRPEGTVLGSRRLSILDPTSAADQPFSSGGLHLVYNGEIYNFRDIRSQLEAGGVGFSTSSDTEVLIEAWRAWVSFSRSGCSSRSSATSWSSQL